jgi:hypothetical protein
MKPRTQLAAAALGYLAFLTAVPAFGAPPPTPLALQAIQAKEFDADKQTVFASVMDVLQDAGFTVVSADLNTGFITATSPYGKQGYNIWWGVARGSTHMTGFIETLANGRTRVRLNFTRLTDQVGWSFAVEHKEKALTDAQIYQAMFEKIDEALFVRKASNSPAPAKTAITSATGSQEGPPPAVVTAPASPDPATTAPSLGTAPPPPKP